MCDGSQLVSLDLDEIFGGQMFLVSRPTYLLSPRFLSIHAHETLLIRKSTPKEPIPTHWTSLTNRCCGALRQFAGDLVGIWAVVGTLPGKSAQGMNLLLTFSTIQQSTPVLNRRDHLKNEKVDVLSAVVEARNVSGRSAIEGAFHALSSCLLHSLTNAVYIKRSYACASACTMCIFILAYCLP